MTLTLSSSVAPVRMIVDVCYSFLMFFYKGNSIRLLDCGFQNSMKMSPSDTSELHCQVSREDSAAHPIKPMEENRLL